MDLFEVKLKYQEAIGDGRLASNTESYIVEAFNYTDAEAVITEMVERYSYITPEIKSMKPVKYSDIFTNASGSIWYKVDIKLLAEVTDEGKEKWVKQSMLVQGTSIDDASKTLKSNLANTSADWTSVAIKETKIADIIRK